MAALLRPVRQGQREQDRSCVHRLGLAQTCGGVPAVGVSSSTLDPTCFRAVGCAAGAGQVAPAGDGVTATTGYWRAPEARGLDCQTGRRLEKRHGRALSETVP